MSLTCDQSNVSAGSRISHTLQKSDFPLRRIIPDVFGGTTKIELDMTITQGESGNASSSVFHSVVGDTFTCGYSSNEVGKKAAYPLESESCTFIDPSGDLVTLEWRVTEVDNPDFEAVPDFNDETFRIEHTKSGMEYSRIYKPLKLADDPEGDQEYQKIDSEPESDPEEDGGSDDLNNTDCGWRIVDGAKK